MEKKYHYEEKPMTKDELLAYFERISKISRLRITHELIKGDNNKVLDVGCGPAYLSEFFKDKIGEYVGTDLIEYNVELAREFYSAPNHTFTSENIFAEPTKVLKKGYFDYVLVLEVIEHIDNPAGFISKCAEFAKKGGCLIISTPNATSITNILLNIKKRKEIVTSYKATGVESDHLYAWDRITLQNLLVKLGFKIVDVRLSRNYITKGQQIIIKARKV